MGASGLAPAKVNLFLHVGPAQPDGYHPLASLVAFADIGDRIAVAPADRLSLAVAGPFGEGLADDGNLILRALRRLGELTGEGEPRLAVALDKRLPVAAGLGGGSSDAGAALRLAAPLLALRADDPVLEIAASHVGADGPMCLKGRTAWAEGRGDVLTEEPRLPPLHALLVNPGAPSSTGAVYRAFDAMGQGRADRPAPPARWDPAAVIEWLGRARNDLEAPAVGLEPAIGRALAAVRALPDVRLVRMSGSGATVFGLFDDAASVSEAAAALQYSQDGWWVRPCTLGIESE